MTLRPVRVSTPGRSASSERSGRSRHSSPSHRCAAGVRSLGLKSGAASLILVRPRCCPLESKGRPSERCCGGGEKNCNTCFDHPTARIYIYIVRAYLLPTFSQRVHPTPTPPPLGEFARISDSQFLETSPCGTSGLARIECDCKSGRTSDVLQYFPILSILRAPTYRGVLFKPLGPFVVSFPRSPPTFALLKQKVWNTKPQL